MTAWTTAFTFIFKRQQNHTNIISKWRKLMPHFFMKFIKTRRISLFLSLSGCQCQCCVFLLLIEMLRCGDCFFQTNWYMNESIGNAQLCIKCLICIEFDVLTFLINKSTFSQLSVHIFRTLGTLRHLFTLSVRSELHPSAFLPAWSGNP